MTTDTKELLTYAAKAVGLELDEFSYVEKPNTPAYFTAKNYVGRWNPATDDGDSARLRTALEMDVEWYVNGRVKVAVYFYDKYERASKGENAADHSGDKNAALRWATLKLAAEIGRRML